MSTPRNKTFAKDVAKHLDRRRMRRRLAVWTGLVGAAVLAVMYLTCGRGFGIGGKGSGSGSGPGSVVATADAGPKRCEVRVSVEGIFVDGKSATRDEAVTACKATTGADVVVTGNAREGNFKDLKAALEAAGVSVFVHDGTPPDAGP